MKLPQGYASQNLFGKSLEVSLFAKCILSLTPKPNLVISISKFQHDFGSLCFPNDDHGTFVWPRILFMVWIRLYVRR